MKNTIQILIIILLLFSCDTSTKEELKNRIVIKENINSTLTNEKIRQNCSVDSASKNLVEIAKYLEEKDYTFHSKIFKEDFTFNYKEWVTFKDVEKIVYQNCKYIEFDFKKNEPINGSYYPKFRIVEMCFESKEKTKEYCNKFNHIINQQEKNYGYVLENGNRLLYCQTGVNMYGFIIKDFKKDFENIIKNGS